MVGELGELRVSAANVTVLSCAEFRDIGLHPSNKVGSVIACAHTAASVTTHVDIEAEDGILLARSLQACDLALNFIHRRWRPGLVPCTALISCGGLRLLVACIGGLLRREWRLSFGVVRVPYLRTL